MRWHRIWGDFCGTTSCHGVPHIGTAQNICLRFFWFIIFLAATVAFAWQLSLLIKTYLSYPSDIETQLFMDERPFPAVTVCNLNPYKRSAIGNTSVNQLMIQYARAMAASNDSNNDNSGQGTDYGLMDPSIRGDSSKIQARAEDMLLYLAASDGSVRQMATYTQDDLINSCVFNANNCSASDIQLYMDQTYGACYTFNNNTEPYMASRSGPTYGMKLLIITEQNEYLDMTEMAGARITIQSQDEPSFPDVFGYYAAPGYTNSFSLSYKKTIRAGSPYEACILDSDGKTNFYTTKYTTEACVRSSYQLLIGSKCGCVYPRYVRPPTSDLPYCDETMLSCVSDVMQSVDNMNQIQAYCTRPCTENTFDVAVSSAMWPGSYTPNTCTDPTWGGDTNACVQWYGNNTMVIEIFFESMVYQVLNESPAYTMTNFISDIGGQMGLWIGLYAVTIFEFVVLFWSLLCCCRCTRRRV